MSFDRNIPEIEKKIGYTFKDKSLLTQAFTRTSYCNEHRQGREATLQSNEVLEFFGDSVLSAAIITVLLKDYTTRYEYGIKTGLNEGDFSNIKSKLSDKKNLSDRMRDLGLSRFLQMGEGDAKLGISDEPSVMEDLFESIIGAIYIDSNMDMVAVIRSVSAMLDVRSYMTAKPTVIQSHKNALQEWCADKSRRLPAPIYKTLSESGPEHKKVYERACYVGDRLCGKGIGKNLKIADSLAAEAALAFLMAESSKKAAKTVDSNSLLKLRELAKKEKKASPIFKDLGETDASTADCPEFAISCQYAGCETVGKGRGKSEARIVSAEKMLKLLKKKESDSIAQKRHAGSKRHSGSIRLSSSAKLRAASTVNKKEKK